MKSIGIRKAIQLFGGTDIEISNGYHYQSGFFNKDGQLYYFSTGDDRMLRSDGQLNVYYRTAEHRKDYIGGRNQYGLVQFLNGMGYWLDKFPSTRQRC